MGHLVQGACRALPSQVLRYGFRTTKGRIGGVSTEAVAWATTVRRMDRSNFMAASRPKSDGLDVRNDSMGELERKVKESKRWVSGWVLVDERPIELSGRIIYDGYDEDRREGDVMVRVYKLINSKNNTGFFFFFPWPSAVAIYMIYLS